MTTEELNRTLHIGRGSFINSRELIDVQQYSSLFLLTDSNIFELYKDKIMELYAEEYNSKRYFILSSGEGGKSLESIISICEQMLISGINRKSLLIALGGGVVTDIGGLTASLFMRGIDHVNIPTTLVGQIDASLGGKCGVNLRQTKNILGVFSTPRKVIIDTEFLDSLTGRQISEGVVEILKIAAVADPRLYQRLIKINCDFNKLTIEEKTEMVGKAAKLKLEIVAKDFRDQGYRRILNFGHTTGHAFEALDSNRFSHGLAVAIGMLVAAELSQRICGLDENIKIGLKKAIINLVADCSFGGIDEKQLWNKIQFDKKKIADDVIFTLLKNIGSSEMMPVYYEQFADAYGKIKREFL